MAKPTPNSPRGEQETYLVIYQVGIGYNAIYLALRFLGHISTICWVRYLRQQLYENHAYDVTQYRAQI